MTRGGVLRESATPRSSEVADEELWRHPAFGITLLVFLLTAWSTSYWWSPLQEALTNAELGVAALLDESRVRGLGAVALVLASLLGGLLASFSPCILPLVPLHLAYIGVHEASGLRSLGLSLRFAAGAALALSVLGVFGTLAGLLLAEYRGVTLSIVGIALLYFGVAVVGLAPLPFGTGGPAARANRIGPFGAGAAFCLVTTPCSSPILGAVVAAAAAQPIPGLAVVATVAFSLGYTALVVLGGLLGGGVVAWAQRFRWAAPRALAAALLIAAGLTWIVRGALWL